jgi:hypothetical protein
MLSKPVRLLRLGFSIPLAATKGMPKKLHGRSIVWLTTQFVSGAGRWGRDSPSGRKSRSKGGKWGLTWLCAQRLTRSRLGPIVGPPKEEFTVLLCQALALAPRCPEHDGHAGIEGDDDRRDQVTARYCVLCCLH